MKKIRRVEFQLTWGTKVWNSESWVCVLLHIISSYLSKALFLSINLNFKNHHYAGNYIWVLNEENTQTIYIYIYIYIYICVCVCVCVCVYVYFKMNRFTKRFIFFKELLISFLNTCLFPACCFRQRTFSNLFFTWMWHKAIWMRYQMRLELTRVGFHIQAKKKTKKKQKLVNY